MNNKQRIIKVEYVFVLLILIIMTLLILNSDKLVKKFYPFSHRELVVANSQRFQVDPYLILAVMKTESKFRNEAVSPKGARGLMQIMPETGQWIAEQLKIEDFHPDRLFEPEINIMFGTWYLSYLSREFNHNLTVVLSAYNAGPGKTKEWLTGGIWDGTINSLEDVPFTETRNYISRVIRHFRIYSDLYKKQ
ncbi:MAG: lytic transglycosylase domain-containing protein [Clostridia bacterium]|nr:lytic transglycosylase domain-containing protein [Clostridia bacterium]